MFLRGHGSQEHSKNNGGRVGVTTTSHASGNLGAIQGDASRRMYGGFGGSIMFSSSLTMWPDVSSMTSINSNDTVRRAPKNAMNLDLWRTRFKMEYVPGGYDHRGEAGYIGGLEINSAYMLPTADEIRPANIAVKYIIKVK